MKAIVGIIINGPLLTYKPNGVAVAPLFPKFVSVSVNSEVSDVFFSPVHEGVDKFVKPLSNPN